MRVCLTAYSFVIGQLFVKSTHLSTVALAAPFLCLLSLKFQVAPKYGTIFSLSMDNQLCTIDPSTGVSTPIGPAMPDELEAQELSSIDNKNALFYIVSVPLCMFVCV